MTELYSLPKMFAYSLATLTHDHYLLCINIPFMVIEHLLIK